MIVNLQILRAVAAWMVFLHHFSVYLRPALPYGTPTGLGAAGVDVFFVISGFIMVATTAGRDIGPTEFLLRRVARLFPVYAFVTLLVALIAFAGFRPVGVVEIQPSYVVQSLLFIPFLRGDYLEPLVAAGWTLNYEMFFYVVFAALLTVRSEPIRLAALVCAMIGLGLASLLQPSGFYARFYTQPIIIEFAFGAVLGFAYTRLRHELVGPGWRPLGYGLIAAGVLLLVASEVVAHALGSGIDSRPFYRLLFWGTAGLSIVAGALVVERSGQVWTSAFLLGQGNASYSIYLIHNLVLHASSKVALALAPDAWTAAGLTLGLAVPVTMALGALLYCSVEAPLNHGLRGILDPSGVEPGGRKVTVQP